MDAAAAPTNIDCPPPGSAEWLDAVGRLHAALRRAEYDRCQWIPTKKRLLAAPLEPLNLWHFWRRDRRRLLEPTAVPRLYRWLERSRRPETELLLGFFGLGEPLPAVNLQQLLDQLADVPALARLQELGIVRQTNDGQFECRLRFIPHGRLLMVTDREDRSIPDFTYIGRDSLKLADLLGQSLADQRFGRGLDICCGSGIQALTLAGIARQVSGVDINPRSIAFSKLNATLNGLIEKSNFALGDLTDGIDGPFDIIVANPPFVFMPPESKSTNRDGYGGELGLDLVGRIVADLDRLLGPRGEAYMLSASPVVNGKSLLEETIRRQLGQAQLGVHLSTLHYRVDPQLHPFQRRHGMRYEIAYYVHISRNLPPGIAVKPLSMLPRLANRAYVEMANLACR